MLDEGVWANVQVGNEHLRLFSEHNAQGVRRPYTMVALSSGLRHPSRWMISNRGKRDPCRAPH